MNRDMEKYHHYKRNVIVSANDMDFKVHITPTAVMSYFQNAAAEHAELSGYGYENLIKKNLAWVVLRMSIRILENPAMGETLHLLTLPEKPSSANVDRDYYAYNEAGELLMCGTSKWCVIDINTHKIQRLTSLFENHDYELFVPEPPFENSNPKLEALEGSDNIEGPFPFSVRVTDLDRNNHMNNTRYGDAVLNVCGMEMLEKYSVSQLDVNFMSELFLGDKFDVYKVQKDKITHIEAKKDQDAVFRAKVVWK